MLEFSPPDTNFEDFIDYLQHDHFILHYGDSAEDTIEEEHNWSVLTSMFAREPEKAKEIFRGVQSGIEPDDNLSGKKLGKVLDKLKKAHGFRDYLNKGPVLHGVKNQFLMRTLIDSGAGVNNLDIDNHLGKPAMHSLILSELEENEIIPLVRILVENGADVNIAGQYGATALQLAADHGYSSLTEYLIGKPVMLMHPLIESELVEDDIIPLMRVMVKNGADVNIKGQYSETALHDAANHGYSSLTEYLMKNRAADLEAQNEAGETALFIAAARGHDHIVHLLLRAGANPDASNKNGKTIGEVAKGNARQRIEMERFNQEKSFFTKIREKVKSAFGQDSLEI